MATESPCSSSVRLIVPEPSSSNWHEPALATALATGGAESDGHPQRIGQGTRQTVVRRRESGRRTAANMESVRSSSSYPKKFDMSSRNSCPSTDSTRPAPVPTLSKQTTDDTPQTPGTVCPSRSETPQPRPGKRRIRRRVAQLRIHHIAMHVHCYRCERRRGRRSECTHVQTAGSFWLGRLKVR